MFRGKGKRVSTVELTCSTDSSAQRLQRRVGHVVTDEAARSFECRRVFHRKTNEK